MLNARIIWTAIASGALAVLLSNALGQWFNLMDSFALWGIGAGTFFLCALLLGFVFPKATWAVVPIVIGGIAVGMVIDAIYQPLVNNRDRNLWPIGIVIWAIIGVLPITGGFAIGRMLGRVKNQP